MSRDFIDGKNKIYVILMFYGHLYNFSHSSIRYEF